MSAIATLTIVLSRNVRKSTAQTTASATPRLRARSGAAASVRRKAPTRRPIAASITAREDPVSGPSLGRRLEPELRGDGRRDDRPLVLELRQPGEPARQVPVPVAEQLHRR